MEFLTEFFKQIAEGENAAVFYIVASAGLVVALIFMKRLLNVFIGFAAAIMIYLVWCIYTGQEPPIDTIANIPVKELLQDAHNFVMDLIGTASESLPVDDVTDTLTEEAIENTIGQ